jgi:sugar phosphate isomerase/epimerase
VTGASFTLSAFGDEIANDLDEQLRVLQRLGINYLELRSAWGANVLRLADDQVAAIGRTCQKHAVSVSCLGSPIGKSPITEPIEREVANLERLVRISEALGGPAIRIFSFYPPAGERPDAWLATSTARLRRLAEVAERSGVVLLLENEKQVVGDTPERCATLLRGVDSRALRFVWDAANFVQVGVSHPTERGWPLLAEWCVAVQIKDALLSDGRVRPAGQGDAQVPELIGRLRDAGYQGFLALEPHLVVAGDSGGFSGPAGMATAAEALRRVLAEQGCTERPSISSGGIVSSRYLL